ncbi:hypothetical protein [Nitrosospira sp. Nsp1]|uniref:hypothetical protein n=1 Tax=Nitrosospira sp. Nsp1 TaxID=136547 RepID=UPI0008827FF2|nr:hypothetical protein [Nitrosospira sp. Nsp1]SCX40961.1 hypothetical protein SAMN05720354_103184 [Nitrosospira sp. Nsp1]
MNTNKSALKGEKRGAIRVHVADAGTHMPLKNASVSLYSSTQSQAEFVKTCSSGQNPTDGMGRIETRFTDEQGCVTFAVPAPACYIVAYENFPKLLCDWREVHQGCLEEVSFKPEINATPILEFMTSDCKEISCRPPQVGDTLLVKFGSLNKQAQARIILPPGLAPVPNEPNTFSKRIQKSGLHKLPILIQIPRLQGPVILSGDQNEAALSVENQFDAQPEDGSLVRGNIGVSMTRTETEPTDDLPFWTVIRSSTEALSFNNYFRFMDEFFCAVAPTSRFSDVGGKFNELKDKRHLPFTDADAYRLLKAATEAFVMVNCGVVDPDDPDNQFFNDLKLQDNANAYLDRRDLPGGEPGGLRASFKQYVDTNGQSMLPYLALIRSKLPDVGKITVNGDEAGLCYGFIREKLLSPCLIELIWSYWHEEGMLVQTMNAVTRRFQNVRSLGANDPLANVEIDPLRPLNNLIWGYTQDEQHRLTLMRRNYEYDHHYGVRLEGKAVQNFRPADTRSKFLEAFHHLLRLCTVFYKQDDDTTVKADAFPILNALKEVHLILSEGAHNQFGDLPSTARIEMLMQQWLLARPEFREFLPTRLMVAYPEPWMDRVDAMKKLQGWTDTSVMHFRSLAMFGEQLLLSIRYGHWSDVYEPNQAFNWARFWRPQVQGYIHAYRAATGVELAGDTVDSGVDATLPSVLLQKRLAMQQRGA